MASLEEQLALFEKEVLSAVESAGKPNDESKGPIQAPEIGGSSQPTTTTTTKFVPHQLQQKAVNPQHATVVAPTNRYVPLGLPSPPSSASLSLPSAVIESGPALYAPPPSSSSALSSGAIAKASSSSSKSDPPVSAASSTSMFQQLQQQSFKTLALPSDVELLLAKKQASKAHENSYLGAVLRGEKKMKRFVRSCGGQVWEDPSMAEWDPNDFRIFCGDLGNEVSDELLAKAFRKYSSFQKAKVCRDSRTNKSKGFGFVSFRSQEDFIRAMKEMDGKYVGNRPIKLRKSNWKDRNLDMVKKKTKEKKKLGLV